LIRELPENGVGCSIKESRIFTPVMVGLIVCMIGILGAGASSGAAPADTRRSVHSIAADSAVHHFEYVFPDGWIYVFNIDSGHALVDSLPVPTTAGVRGVTLSPPDGMLYISYGGDGAGNGDGSLLQYSLLRDSVGWNVHYTHGIDSHAITPDGTTIFMPSGELTNDGKWYVVSTVDGTEHGVIATGGLNPHNTVVSLDGARVYMGARDVNNVGHDSLYVASAAAHQVVKRAGPFVSGVRPFTINGTETFAFVTLTGFLGFQVANLTTGRVVYTLDLTTMGWTKTGCGNQCATAPSHGISLSPDEKEIYVIDEPNSYVHVFDVSGIFNHITPTKVADIQLQNPLRGNESSCAYDCLRDGWIHHSRDGRFVYVGDAGDVISTATRTVVATLPQMKNTRKMLEIDWKNGRPIATSTRTGVGYVTSQGPPSTPILKLPPNGATNQPNALTCRWNSSLRATGYWFQLAADTLFAVNIVDDSTLTDTMRPVPALLDSTIYYWRVQARAGAAGSSPWSAVWSLTTIPPGAHPYPVRGTWNLLSLPVRPSNPRLTTIFPTSVSDAFAYIAGYQIKDSLEAGRGYWIKFPGDQTVYLAGPLVQNDTIDVTTGWNLIGALGTPVAAASIASIPPGLTTSPFFGFNGFGYTLGDSLRPANGYWVRTHSDGKLILSASGTMPPANRIQIVSTAEAPPDPPAAGLQRNNRSPSSFLLEPVFPNPFNPTATIRYQLPVNSKVSLIVYDLRGQVMEVLRDSFEQAGYKSVEWNATQFASGVYLCRLDATSVNDPGISVIQVRKMVLVK